MFVYFKYSFNYFFYLFMAYLAICLLLRMYNIEW
jgi:hypothetical protein